MEYSKFVQQLAKGMEDKVVAYDNKTEHEGCFIYLYNRHHAIFVPNEIIEYHREEAIRVVREKLAEGLFEARLLVLKLTDNELALIAQCQ